ncbi:MAG: ATPase [Gammaproteobacteria bacterium]|nr:MAG: ATPase [Gammaproteobacteria bacterium]RLA52719.1 MAG: ATPase [Gammaproteobacteria bacterium]
MPARVFSPLDCFHCGLPVPQGGKFTVLVDGQQRATCCIGCQAVASTIVDGGLEKFYQYRTTDSSPGATGTDDNSSADDLAIYDLSEVQDELLELDDQGVASIELSITDISCAACAWLIEHHLGRLPGIEQVSVNVSRHRCHVDWRLEQLRLSELLAAFADIGYRAHPASEADTLDKINKEQRRYLLRLGVAGIGMMQAGMLAIALYAGAFQGMEPRWESLLRWVSLIVASPVVLYSAQPFFIGAWRSLKALYLTMDVPVALAIALAYLFSAWATVTATGEVYFDAVSMLTFFLLVGRFLEMRVRYRNEVAAGEATQLIPITALRLTGSVAERVPVKSLHRGDIILVSEGESVPVDGRVLEGESRVVESVLTGEQRPVKKGPGDVVSAGTINSVNRLKVHVDAVGKATRLAAILDMMDAAMAEKPRQVELANRLAGWFVGFVLVLAVIVFGAWWWHDQEKALWVTLSVLVVTCPCALSLATPVALAAATGRLQRLGFLVRRGHVLQTLAKVTRVVLDKTGTLTSGQMEINRVVYFRAGTADAATPFVTEKRSITEELSISEELSITEEDVPVLAIAAALEQGCRHPIALAFRQRQASQHAEQLCYEVGRGVSGIVNGERYALGKPDFIAEVLGLSVAEAEWLAVLDEGSHKPAQGQLSSATVAVMLASQQGPLAWFVLVDALRPGAGDIVQRLTEKALALELLSGDQTRSVADLADNLGIEEWRANNMPEDKLAHIRHLQEQGDIVLMVGDGINDVPVLSGADISVAMGEAADFTHLAADAVLLSANLAILVDAIEVAVKTETVIRQNIAWALLYNLSALPLAALGWVPPWAAAIGMSISSLVVVLNALRLQHYPAAAGLATAVQRQRSALPV